MKTLTVAFLLTFINLASSNIFEFGICYVCDTKKNPECHKSNFTAGFDLVQKCHSMDCMTIEIGNKSETRYIRSCGSCKVIPNATCFFCQTHFCNGYPYWQSDDFKSMMEITTIGACAVFFFLSIVIIIVNKMCKTKSGFDDLEPLIPPTQTLPINPPRAVSS